MKFKTLLAAAALSLAAAVLFTAPAYADDCNHSKAYVYGNPSGPTCAPHQQRYKCPDCGKEFDMDREGTGQHNYNEGGYCVDCGWRNEAMAKSGDEKYRLEEKRKYKYGEYESSVPTSDGSSGSHSHCFDAWGRCISCGYYCYTYNWGYGPYLPVYATSAVTMTNGFVTMPVAAVASNVRDTANQLALASMLTNLGFKSVTPGATFNLYAPAGYNATGLAQAVMFAAPVSGLKAGDTAFAVYWNGIVHTTQFIPVTVDAFGNAAFVVPNMTGTSIVTLVKCK